MSSRGEKRKFQSLSELSSLVSNSPDERIPSVPMYEKHNGQQKTVCVTLETKGRKGKCVTLVTGLHHNPTTLDDIARILKQFCGAGGTVKDGNIEIQGDNRERVSAKLRELNYVVRKN